MARPATRHSRRCIDVTVMVIQGARPGEERLDGVVDVVRALTRRVDDLTARIGALEAGAAPSQPAPVATAPPVTDEPAAMMSLVGQSRVLQRIAMVSFALVVALVLRTLTDSGLIGVGVGVVLGIAYCALLVAIGGYLLVRSARGQRVLPACGAVLLCSIALEAHRTFHLVSADTVYWILIADLVIVTLLGMHFRMGSIVAFAILAPTVSAFLVGFPDLQFRLAAGLLLLANCGAYLAQRIGRLQWLCWTTFASNLFFWLLWGSKARAWLLHPDAIPATAGLDVDWFVPWLCVFVLFYVGTAAARSLAAPRSPGAFHTFLPTGNALWAHAAGAAVLGTSIGGRLGLGIAGLCAALAHLAFAAWSWRALRQPAVSITAFTLAGVVLLALALPTFVDNMPLNVAVLAAVALLLARFAAVSGSPGLRLGSSLLQLAACVLAIAGAVYEVPSASLPIHLLAAVALTVLSAWQYRHDRLHAPPAGSWYLRLDPHNHGTILLLWTAAVHAFGTLRLLLDRLIGLLGITTPDAFPCGQSVILNCASIAMLLWGLRSGSRHVLLTAGLVVAAGGLKVFGSDLLTASGLPLVLAVFSFGVAAAVGSLVVGRLQRTGAAASNGQAGS